MKRKLDLQFFAESNVSVDTEISVDTSVETSAETSEEEAEESAASVTAENTENSAQPAEETEKESNDSVLSEEMLRKIYGHIAKLEEETRELKETFPDFDLYRELKNPAFARLTAPESGIHAVDAYYAIHRKEIQSMHTERNSTEKKPEPKKDPPKRPSENGISAQAPAIMDFDYRNASKERREALKKAIRAAATRGEKIYPS